MDITRIKNMDITNMNCHINAIVRYLTKTVSINLNYTLPTSKDYLTNIDLIVFRKAETSNCQFKTQGVKNDFHSANEYTALPVGFFFFFCCFFCGITDSFKNFLKNISSKNLSPKLPENNSKINNNKENFAVVSSLLFILYIYIYIYMRV